MVKYTTFFTYVDWTNGTATSYVVEGKAHSKKEAIEKAVDEAINFDVNYTPEDKCITGVVYQGTTSGVPGDDNTLTPFSFGSTE